MFARGAPLGEPFSGNSVDIGE